MTPWMHQSEIELIEKYLSPKSTMLEWGSGGSTLHFPQFVKQYYSIEHDNNWYFKICDLKPDNVVYYFQPPNELVSPPKSTHAAYKDYIERAGKLKKKFDVVLIDGRSRLACAIYIKQFIHKYSIVFIHDFYLKDRQRYMPVLNHYNIVESIKNTEQTIVALQLK